MTRAEEEAEALAQIEDWERLSDVQKEEISKGDTQSLRRCWYWWPQQWIPGTITTASFRAWADLSFTTMEALSSAQRAPTFTRLLFRDIIQEYGDWSGAPPEPTVETPNDRHASLSEALDMIICDARLPRSDCRELRSLGIEMAEGGSYSAAAKSLRGAIKAVLLEI